jgi:hypothetical protein
MINIKHLREAVIQPTLDFIGLYSPAAENLLIGTALVESNASALVQIGGPALSPYQIEPATDDDCWGNFLKYRKELATKVEQLLAVVPDRTSQLITNLAYATAMCRIVYLRAPSKLPAADDIQGLANYWKINYNSMLGKGNPEEFVKRYNAHGR